MSYSIKLEHYLAAHQDCIYACAKKTEKEFFTGGGDKKVLLWNLEDPSKAQVVAQTEGSIYLLQKLSDTLLLIGSNQGEVYIIDFEKKKLIAEINLGKTVFDAVVLQKEQFIYLALADGYLAKLSMKNLRFIGKSKAAANHLRSLIAYDETRVSAGSSDGNIYFIDHYLQLSHTIKKAHSDSVFSLFKAGKNQLISGGKDAHLKLWDFDKNSARDLNDVPAHMFTINHIIESPFEGKIFTASRDKSIKLWDSQTLLLEKVIDRTKIDRASTHSVNKLAWLGKDNLLAVGDDRIARVYKVERN